MPDTSQPAATESHVGTLLARPGFWIVLQGAVWIALLAMTGRLAPRLERDSESYLAIARGDLFSAAALLEIRTLGYPLFLRLLEVLHVGVGGAPPATVVAYVAAVWAFATGLCRLGIHAGAATAAASMLLYVDAVRECPPDAVLTDLLALACAIFAMAALLRVVSRDASRLDWVLLAVSVASCYHVRPAYLFMVLLVPLLGWLLLAATTHAAEFEIRARGFAVRAVLVAAVPLLAYCSLRGALVGRFGLLSFAGCNLVGLAAQLLTPEMVPTLPERHRALGTIIVHELASRPGLKSPLFGAHGVLEEVVTDQYNVFVWRIAYPAMRLGVRSSTEADAELLSFSLAVLARCPLRYAWWYAKALRRAATEGLGLFFLVPLAGLVAALHARIFAQWLRPRGGPLLTAGRRAELELLVNVLFLVAFWFSLSKMLLVVAVEPPIRRYVFPAFCFWPSLAVAASLWVLAAPDSAPASSTTQGITGSENRTSA